MKAWAFLSFALIAGCAVSRRPAPTPVQAMEAQGHIDRLRIDEPYRPPVVYENNCLSCFYELPKGAYVAQGWPYYYCYPIYPGCEDGRFFFKRSLCGSCCSSPCRCHARRFR